MKHDRGVLIVVSALLMCACTSLAAENITCTMTRAQIRPRVSEVPSILIPRMPAAPKIDGMVGEAEWSGAESVTGFVKPVTGVPADPQTTTWLGVDQRNLYVAVRCHHVPGSEPRAEAREHDGQVWVDDSIEFHLQPDTARNEYFQIIVNPVGSQYDGRNAVDGSKRREYADWNPPTQVRTGREPGAWTVEMAIPLESLGLAPDGIRAVRLNLFRSEHRQSWQPSSWAYLPVPSAHTPAAFGVGIITFDDLSGERIDMRSIGLAGGTGLLRVEPRSPACLLPGSFEVTARMALPDRYFSASPVHLEAAVIPVSDEGKGGTPIPAGRFRLRSASPVTLSLGDLTPGDYHFDITVKWRGGQVSERLPIMVRQPQTEVRITGSAVIDDREWKSAKAEGIENALTSELLLKTEWKYPVTAFDPTDDETITCMADFSGKLYVGSCTQPMMTDTGSIYTYDADLDVWEKSFQVNEQGLISMKVYGDRLYIPGLDANDGGWDLGNIYIHDGHSWVERRTVPWAVHISDLVKHEGRIYLSADIGEEPPAGMSIEAASGKDIVKPWGAVVSSDDEGRTWRVDYRGTEPGQDVVALAAFGDRLVLNKKGDLVVFDGTNWKPCGLRVWAYDLIADGDTLFVLTSTGLRLFDGEQLRESKYATGFRVRAAERFGDLWVLAGYSPPNDARMAYPNLDDALPRFYNVVAGFPGEILAERMVPTDDEWRKSIRVVNPKEMCVSAKCFRGRLYLGTHHADGRVLVLPVVKEGTLDSLARRVESAGEYKLWWSAAIPPGTSVAFQIRTAATEAEIESKPFVGPDGSKDSFFAAQGTGFSMSGPGFVQYRVKLATDNPARSPYVKRVVITRTER